MVVCKFFQQGYCRYGQNCRFEHIYGSKYSYHANPPTQTQVAQANVVTDEQLVNQVKSDIQAALKGGQWIISSYAPFKEKPGYPGLSDLSPEEARLFIYEAKTNNTVDQAVAYLDNLFKESRYKYEQLLRPTVNTIKILKSLYKGENISTAAATENISQTTAFGVSNNASSLFRGALSNTNTSVFNQNTNQSVCGQNADTAAKSIFAQANHASFGPTNTSVFSMNTNETAPKSLFAQETQKIFGPNNPVNIFASASQNFFGTTNEPYGHNVFVSQSPVNVFQKADQASDVFQRKDSQNVFSNANNVFEQKSDNTGNVYSNKEDLSSDDLGAFTSNEFKLGFIPEVPPPKELCV